jgi:hypothetical protein
MPERMKGKLIVQQRGGGLCHLIYFGVPFLTNWLKFRETFEPFVD